MGKQTDRGKPKAAPTPAAGALNDALVLERKQQIEALLEKAPEKVREAIKAQSLVLAKVAVWIERVLLPLLVMVYEYLVLGWAKLQPHINSENMQDIIPAVCGLALCFYGGTFPLVIASVEAFRMAGYDGIKAALLQLKDETVKAFEAHEKDNQKDDDGDGIPDVEQISPTEKLSRKALLFLRVVNPDRVTTAIHHLTTGLLAVLATLKMEFARALTMGASLAGVAKSQVEKHFADKIDAIVPPEYKKWTPAVLDYSLKFICLIFAMLVQRIISAFFSAVRGGKMFGEGILRFGTRKGYFKIDPENSYVDEAVGYACIAAGFTWQLYSGFQLGFLGSLFLMPISIWEGSLAMAISWV